jgi:pyruvate kinase
MTRATKIVATLGPASASPDVLDRLLLAGVDVVRLNLSHGSVDEHVRRLPGFAGVALLEDWIDREVPATRAERGYAVPSGSAISMPSSSAVTA